jgi:hypothetical protein
MTIPWKTCKKCSRRWFSIDKKGCPFCAPVVDRPPVFHPYGHSHDWRTQ